MLTEDDGLALLDADLEVDVDGLKDLEAELDGLSDGEDEATALITAVQIAAVVVPVFLYTFPPVLSKS